MRVLLLLLLLALPIFVIGAVLESTILPPMLAQESHGQIEIGAGSYGTVKLVVNLFLLPGAAGFLAG